MRRYQTPHALAPETGAVIIDTLERSPERASDGCSSTHCEPRSTSA